MPFFGMAFTWIGCSETPASTSQAESPDGSTSVTPEAGQPGDAGALSDASADTGLSDGSTGTDGGCRALFCDDFEAHHAGQAPGAPWTVRTWQNDSQVTIDGAHAHSGTNALKVAVTAGSGKRAAVENKSPSIFPLSGNAMYGRMWIWLTQAPPDGVHWTNIQGEGPVAGQSFRAMYRYGGMNQQRFLANYETTNVSTDCWKESATVIPQSRWACFEWHFDGPTNQMNFWMDGTALADLTVMSTGAGCIGQATNGVWQAPTFDALLIGWEHYQSSSVPISMWIDDVAVAAARVSCQ